ncbi:ABC transporter ATP-binding protein [Candidatus Woesearchaeota archaeon]|nr:ABC transporter ATP-binding protein [Candidatus Woesearchaeota archaeon]
MNYIEVQNLVKAFKERGKAITAVNNVSFSVRKGEIFGLLGPNGAGKSTTINMLTGLLEKDSGNIKILDFDPDKNWEYVKNNSNVATAYSWLSDVLTIRQNLRVYAKLYGVKNYEHKIDELLEMFELKNVADRKIIRLSSGENTRAVLCKGLINNPKVLFLDECTVGLDPDIADKTRGIIKDYQKKNDCTILFTSHYMYEVEELCGRIAFMSNGKIIRIDTSSNLKKLIKKHTVEIAVKKNIKLLKEFLKTEGVDIVFEKDNSIVFEVTTEEDKMYKVISKIFHKGFMLSNLHVKGPTLDDIFIKIARGK